MIEIQSVVLSKVMLIVKSRLRIVCIKNCILCLLHQFFDVNYIFIFLVICVTDVLNEHMVWCVVCWLLLMLYILLIHYTIPKI